MQPLEVSGCLLQHTDKLGALWQQLDAPFALLASHAWDWTMGIRLRGPASTSKLGASACASAC